MKSKKTSRILTALLAVALVVSLANGALAARGTLAVQSGVTLSETNGSPRFTINTNDGSTNLFQDEAGDFRNLMPGDTRVSKTITVRTAALNQNSYRIFLYARECEAADGAVHVKQEAGKTNDQSMLQYITINVYQVDGDTRRLVSSGIKGDFEMGSIPGEIGEDPSAESTAQLGTEAGALLGLFAPGDKVELQVELSVDIEAGNEFANKAAYIDWVFFADTIPDAPDRPDRPSGGGGGTPPTPPRNPDVTIEDPEVPLAETPPPTEEEIEDEGVPLGGMPPETGDTAMMIVWLGLAVLSGGGMIVLATTGRKSKEKAAR